MAANTTENNATVSSLDELELERQAVSRFFARVGKGWKAYSFEERSVSAKLNAAQIWRTRRAKYGPTGRKPNDYQAWRKARGLPPVESTFDSDKEKP